MRFEWDDFKSQLNIRKHGLDFLDAREIFDGRPRLDIPSPRWGEERFLSVAFQNGRLMAVAWTERHGDVVRIISFRRARHGEEIQYRQLHS